MAFISHRRHETLVDFDDGVFHGDQDRGSQGDPAERRGAMVPTVVDRVIRLGAELVLESGAGDAVKLPDTAYHEVALASSAADAAREADIVLAVEPPDPETIRSMRDGAILISFLYANKEPALVKLLGEKKITCFAMERVPRITRAQAFDALSSQAALSGYYAALLSATHLARVLLRMTTTVGMLRPAQRILWSGSRIIETYVQYRRKTHPGESVMTYEEFYWESRRRRYTVEKGKFMGGCC